MMRIFWLLWDYELCINLSQIQIPKHESKVNDKYMFYLASFRWLEDGGSRGGKDTAVLSATLFDANNGGVRRDIAGLPADGERVATVSSMEFLPSW